MLGLGGVGLLWVLLTLGSTPPFLPPAAGSRGREKGEFTNLQGISTSSSGRIVVADSNNQCVQVGLPSCRPCGCSGCQSALTGMSGCLSGLLQ